jgi:hypothetical protein
MFYYCFVCDGVASSSQQRGFSARRIANDLQLSLNAARSSKSFKKQKSISMPGSRLELARRQGPNIDRATVYRTIQLLIKLRLIDELHLMHLEGEKLYYEVKTKPDHICLACFRSAQCGDLKTSRFHDPGNKIGGRGDCRACANSSAQKERKNRLQIANH